MLVVALPVPLALVYSLFAVIRARRLPGYRPSPWVTALLGLVLASSVAMAGVGAYYAHRAREPQYRAGNEWADLGFAFAVGILVYGVVILVLTIALLVVRAQRVNE